MELDQIIENIRPENKALARGREVLEWISQGKHRQSEAYAASLHLFLGGDPESALAALKYGIQQNQRNTGLGLYGEIPPDERTHKTFEALKNNAAEFTSIIEEAYDKVLGLYDQLSRHHLVGKSETGVKLLRRTLERFEKIVLGYITFESAFNKGIRCEDCKYISDYSMRMSNVIKRAMELGGSQK